MACLISFEEVLRAVSLWNGSLGLKVARKVEFADSLRLDDHLIHNQVYEPKELRTNLRSVVQIKLSRVHGIVSDNADDV